MAGLLERQKPAARLTHGHPAAAEAVRVLGRVRDQEISAVAVAQGFEASFERGLLLRRQVLVGLVGEPEVSAVGDGACVHAVRTPHPGHHLAVVVGQKALGIAAPGDPLLVQPLVQVELQGLAGDVEVDLREHVVAGQDQALDRVQTLGVDAQAVFPGRVVVEGPHRRDHLVEVEVAVADAAEQGVAQQVVHLVDVELAADDGREQALRSVETVAEQPDHVGTLDAVAEALEDAADLVAGEQPPAHLLVVDSVLEQILGPVAERGVAEIVEQCGGPDQAAGARPGAGIERHLLGPRQGVVDTPGEVHRAEGVAEAAVLGAWEYEMGQAELANGTQALHRPGADQRRLQLVGFDEAVDGIAEGEVGRRVHRGSHGLLLYDWLRPTR